MKQNAKPIGILGCGVFGTALGYALTRNSHKVMAWDIDTRVIQACQDERTHPRLKHLKIPRAILYVSFPEEIFAACDIVIMAVPTAAIPALAETIKPVYNPRRHRLVTTSKGLLDGPLPFFVDYFVRTLKAPKSKVAHLAGPSFAAEVAEGKMTVLTIATFSKKNFFGLGRALEQKNVHIDYLRDIHGAQLAGAAKNMYALVFGAAAGLHLGDNVSGWLFTQIYRETAMLMKAAGGTAETMQDFCALGDMSMTLFSGASRNFAFGRAFVLGNTKVVGTVEGVHNVSQLKGLAKRYQLKLPLLEAAHAIFLKNQKPAPEFQKVFNRL